MLVVTHQGEEVESAVMQLRNGKAAGEHRIQAELLKSGGIAVIDWLHDRAVTGGMEDKTSTARVERCNTCATP